VVSPTFYAVWRRNGGQATFGDARGAEFEEVDPDTGQRLTVQYFDRARLEYHPTSAGTPYQVELGRLGAEEAKQRGLLDTEPFRPVPESAAQSTPDCEYFAETGHRLCGRFRDYWHSHGLKLGDANTTSTRESDALLGYPISEEFTDPETGLITQYFERARLEYRPERAGTPDEVVAGNLDVGQP
jgi:spore germination protein